MIAAAWRVIPEPKLSVVTIVLLADFHLKYGVGIAFCEEVSEAVRAKSRDRSAIRILFVADVVERAIQLKEFSDNGTVCNLVPTWRRVRHFLDEFNLK